MRHVKHSLPSLMFPAHGVSGRTCGKVAAGLEQAVIREKILRISRAKEAPSQLGREHWCGQPLLLDVALRDGI